MKNKFFMFVVFVMILASTTVLAVEFSDLATAEWAREYITYLTDKGVVNGYPDGTFKPDDTISRAEFLKLVIAAAMPEDVPISLAPSSLEHWAGQYLFVAETYRVVDPGTINLENIDEPITRKEMALMVSKADINLRGKSMNTSKSLTFTDYDLMDGSEIRFLTHAVSEEYLNGYPDGSFGPDNNMTRAEAATVIYRFTGGRAGDNTATEVN